MALNRSAIKKLFTHPIINQCKGDILVLLQHDIGQWHSCVILCEMVHSHVAIHVWFRMV